MQHIDISIENDIHRVSLPDAGDEWSQGHRWGDASLLLTPAWIAKHAHMRWRLGTYSRILGGSRWTLEEETVFCILSGFGIRAETAEAALMHLQQAGLFKVYLNRQEIEALLRQPLQLADGRRGRYRFPRKRADYIHDALERLREFDGIGHDLTLRDNLLTIRGIGPKTASFIVRNLLASDNVAILDIHVLRAGKIARVFPTNYDLAKDYGKLERRFLEFARAAKVPASILDATIWEMTRELDFREMAAADRLNRALIASTGLLVPTYDPYAILETGMVIPDRGGVDDRGQQELPDWR
jgi:thermostable 8-oxoguanine DNA glycosylase